jgi:hypothetical protein
MTTKRDAISLAVAWSNIEWKRCSIDVDLFLIKLQEQGYEVVELDES